MSPTTCRVGPIDSTPAPSTTASATQVTPRRRVKKIVRGDENEQRDAYVGALLRPVACEMGADRQTGCGTQLGQLGDVGRDEEIEKVAYVYVVRVGILDPVGTEVLDSEERCREHDERPGCRHEASAGVAHMVNDSRPVERAKHDHRDGGRNRLHGQDLLPGEQLRPCQHPEKQTITPRCLCLHHEQSVQQDQQKGGAHYERLGKMSDGLRDYVWRKTENQRARGEGRGAAQRRKATYANVALSAGAVVIKML